MPGTIEDLTESLGTCYLIFRFYKFEACYDQRGLLSRLNRYEGSQFEVYFVDKNNTSQAIRPLKKSGVRKIHQTLKKAKKLRRDLSDIEIIIGLPE